MKRSVLCFASVYTFGIDDTAHLEYIGRSCQLCLFLVFILDGGCNFHFCMTLIGNIRIVSGIARVGNQLFGSGVKWYRYVNNFLFVIITDRVVAIFIVFVSTISNVVVSFSSFMLLII